VLRDPDSNRYVRSGLTGLLLTIGVGLTGCHGANAPAQPAADVAQGTWDDYRKYHPFHSQEVALSEPLGDRRRVIILSEPPDGVTAATLAGVHPALGGLVAKRHPIGVDGWTEDLVGVLPPMSADELSDLTSDLHVALFGTSYRARLAPIAPVRKWSGTLDVEVRPKELHDWVFGDRAAFWPVDGGPAALGSDLLAPEQTGVYLSKTPGIVLWSFPKKESFDAQRANVRIFGVESDLVLGAFADEDSVLVVGRERVAPVDVLPPLRFETIKILVTAPLHELRQSYERQQIFAGPLQNGMDWAPILLSPEILDTELGSTLNIADQLLKRWSMNGMIDYARFDYPRQPGPWAFDKPIASELNAGSLTFNWNTAASGGLVELPDGRALYWMNRTGALHVSYLPGDELDPRTVSYEEKAREFFAQQSDPYLVRAVQYTALFQAFRQLGVASVDPVADAEQMIDAGAGNEALEAAGTDAFSRLVTASAGDLEAAGRRFTDRSFANVSPDAFKAFLLKNIESSARPEEREGLLRHLRAADADRTLEVIERVKALMAQDAAKDARALQSRLARTGDPAAPKHLAVALVHSALTAAATREPAQWQNLLDALRTPGVRKKAADITAAAAFLQAHGFRLEDAAGWRDAAIAMSDVEAIEKQYREISMAHRARSRVRTPSVVQSNGAKILVRGGHNVGSEVSRLRQAVQPLELNQVRFAREGLSFEPTVQLPRSRATALGAVAERSAPSTAEAAGSRPLPPRGAETGARRLTEENPFSCGSDCVVIKPYEAAAASSPEATVASNGYKVDVGGSVFHAESKHGIADTIVRSLDRQARLSGKKPLTVDIILRDSRLTPDEARGTVQSLHSQLARRSLGAEDGYVLDRSGGVASLGDFDLERAVVSEPVRSADGFNISVMVPRKPGAAQSLIMRVLGKGEPPLGAGTAADAAVKSGLRSPADIARELQHRLGKDGGVLLLELGIDAQPDLTENEPSVPRAQHAGTTGHSL
jgi:hypothetical protein